MRTSIRIGGIALLVALLVACGSKQQRAAADSEAATGSLPKPGAVGGSVTGMPQAPGPGDVPLTGEPPAPVDDGAQAAIDLFNPETGVLPGGEQGTMDAGSAATGTEPTAADAVAVLRDYYASIDGRSYARAYALWSDGGRASGQTPQQFADGFSDTAQVTAQIGVPRDEDAGAGQRHLTVPVSVDARQAEGQARRFIGDYVLHRSVVDGATAEQRAWRIASADLREVKP